MVVALKNTTDLSSRRIPRSAGGPSRAKRMSVFLHAAIARQRTKEMKRMASRPFVDSKVGGTRRRLVPRLEEPLFRIPRHHQRQHHDLSRNNNNNNNAILPSRRRCLPRMCLTTRNTEKRVSNGVDGCTKPEDG